MLLFNGSSKALNDTDEFPRGAHDEIEAGSCTTFVIDIWLSIYFHRINERIEATYVSICS